MVVTVTVTVTVAMRMTSVKSCLRIIDPESETLNHVSNIFDSLELGFQSIKLGEYTPHPDDLHVGILYYVTCTIVVRLDGVFCGILQLSAGPSA
jgi:hypothetical protein